MAGIKAKKKITGVQSTKGVKKGKREKETGDLNSIEYLNFFCLRGLVFFKAAWKCGVVYTFFQLEESPLYI